MGSYRPKSPMFVIAASVVLWLVGFLMMFKGMLGEDLGVFTGLAALVTPSDYSIYSFMLLALSSYTFSLLLAGFCAPLLLLGRGMLDGNAVYLLGKGGELGVASGMFAFVPTALVALSSFTGAYLGLAVLDDFDGVGNLNKALKTSLLGLGFTLGVAFVFGVVNILIG